MALPIKGGRISTPWNKKGRHWSTGFHTGVDFAVPEGTNVLAVADGKIEAANWGKAYGVQLVQSCNGGYFIYAHLSKALVKPGDKVKKGQHIAESGNTGNSTGAHLHVELRTKLRWSDGKPIDPKDILAS
jgi:murein DD-endopeptidase MepM/ murein hydrolase activator NlpD